MSFAAQHFLSGVIASLALRSVAFDRLCIDDRQRRASLAAVLLPIGHHQMVVDPLHMAAIGQEPPIVIADARRWQILRHRVPRDAVAQDVPDPVHYLPQRITPWPTLTLRNR